MIYILHLIYLHVFVLFLHFMWSVIFLYMMWVKESWEVVRMVLIMAAGVVLGRMILPYSTDLFIFFRIFRSSCW